MCYSFIFLMIFMVVFFFMKEIIIFIFYGKCDLKNVYVKLF